MKNMFLCILRSLVSIFHHDINLHDYLYANTEKSHLKNDPNYNKVAKTKDSKINYENTVYDRMGYLTHGFKELATKASKEDSSVTVDATNANESSTKIY